MATSSQTPESEGTLCALCSKANTVCVSGHLDAKRPQEIRGGNVELMILLNRNTV